MESRIIDHLQQFLLELGTGFAFVGRQVRFTFDEEQQIFASKYETVLPSKEDLKKLLEEHLADEDGGEIL